MLCLLLCRAREKHLQLSDALEHLEQVSLQQEDVLHHANDLDDLFVRQEVKAWEVLPLRLEVLDQRLHQLLQLGRHCLRLLYDALTLRKHAEGLGVAVGPLHDFPVLSVELEERLELLLHL